MTPAAEKLIEAELADAAQPCVTASFQAECVVLIHLLIQVRPDIPVLFIDTMHHFEETLRYRDRIVAEWAINLVTLRAESPMVGAWRRDVDACCAHHKTGPLFHALTEYDTWFTGLRREQAASRASLAAVAPFALPGGRSIRKVSPLAAWSTREVWRYAEEHRIPLLPLYERGYSSIGCAPCTQLPSDPDDPRSGRWQGRKLECGIHIESAKES